MPERTKWRSLRFDGAGIVQVQNEHMKNAARRGHLAPNEPCNHSPPNRQNKLPVRQEHVNPQALSPGGAHLRKWGGGGGGCGRRAGRCRWRRGSPVTHPARRSQSMVSNRPFCRPFNSPPPGCSRDDRDADCRNRFSGHRCARVVHAVRPATADRE